LDIAQSRLSLDDMMEALFQRAVAAYGQEHAQAMRPALEQMAHHLFALSNSTAVRDPAPSPFM